MIHTAFVLASSFKEIKEVIRIKQEFSISTTSVLETLYKKNIQDSGSEHVLQRRKHRNSPKSI